MVSISPDGMPAMTTRDFFASPDRDCDDGVDTCLQDCLTDVGCPIGYACLPVGEGDIKQCVAKSADCEDLGICQDDGDCSANL